MAVKAPYSLAVTGGKGGVGKSCVALNLGIALARLGERVLLVDADWGLGNLALLTGQYPARSIEEVLTGACGVGEALLEGPEGVVLLPAASEWAGPAWDETVCDEEAVLALGALEVDFDCVVVDTGAGVDDKVVAPAAAADAALLVTTPDPTAVADTYALLKVLLRGGCAQARLLVNMADDAEEAAELQARFAELAGRFLGAEIDNAGYIPLDRYVRQAIKRQMSFLLLDPPCPATAALESLASRCRGAGRAKTGGRGFFEAFAGQRLAAS